MFQRQCSTQRQITSKRNFYQQQFYIHHPLLDKIIESKLQKCMQYGQVRDYLFNTNTIKKKDKIHIIEAPIISGKTKKLQFKTKSRKIFTGNPDNASRPKTTNTVIRSRTSQPRIRQRLQYYLQDEFEQNLKPTLSIKKFF